MDARIVSIVAFAAVVIGLAGRATAADENPRAATQRSNQGLRANERAEQPDTTRTPTSVPLSPQVSATRTGRPDDGLEANRGISLSPFPNLDLQSGPLAVDQLPWHHKRADESEFSIRQAVEYQTAVGTLKSNGDNDAEVGWYNSVLIGFPFWRERQVGAQIGFSAEPTTFPQVLVEFSAGFFHRAIWPEEPERRLPLARRLSWGIVYDGLYDSELETFVGQARTQVGYALAPHREWGLWVVAPLHDETSFDPSSPLLVDTSALVSFYYRHAFASELDLTTFLGISEFPGGAHFGGYLSYRFAPQAFLILSGVTNFEEAGGYAVYGGLRFHFWPLADYSQISGNPQNLYRPFLPMADHINVQIRKRPR